MHFRLLSLRTAFIVLATVDAVALSAQQAPGYRYDVVTRIKTGAAPFMTMQDTAPALSHITTTAKAWRMDHEPRGRLEGPDFRSDYMVFDGKAVRSVSTATRTVTVMGPEALDAVGQLMQGLPAKMTLSDFSATTDSLGAGGTLLGMPTSHWRTNSSATFTMDMMGQPMTMTQHHITEYWIAPPLAGALDPRASESVLDSVKDGGVFAEFARKQLAANQRMPKGLVVKSETAMEMSMTNPGASFNMKTQVWTEVQNLRSTPVDVHVFDVPADYKVVSVADRMREAMDSARARLEPKKPPQ